MNDRCRFVYVKNAPRYLTVSVEDYDAVCEHNWYYHKNDPDRVLTTPSVRVLEGHSIASYLLVNVWNWWPDPGIEFLHHKNGDRMDWRRENLCLISFEELMTKRRAET